MMSTRTSATLTGILVGAVGALLLLTFVSPQSAIVISRARPDEMSGYCPLPGAGNFPRTPLPATAIASYEGSGTRWTMHLLTTASGIVAGSMAPTDLAVPVNEFYAHRVIGIKSHQTPERMEQKAVPVDRGLVLIRSPYEAILANFNRQGDVRGNATLKHEYSSRKRFEKEWTQYVSDTMQRWPVMYKAWAQSNVPIHVLVYSRMKSDLRRELELVFQFLSIKANIECTVMYPEGFTHRQKQAWQDEVAVFNQEQVQFLNNAIDEVQAALEQRTGTRFDDLQAWKR